MLRFLATSVTVASGLLLAGYWVSAQEPFAAPQPTFTKAAPVPGSPAPVDAFGPVSSSPLGSRRTNSIEPFQVIPDEPTRNRERELSRQANGLVEKYTQAKEAKDKSDVEKELVKTVTDHFNLRQDVREKELLDLEEQLKRLRKVHDQRTAEKERIVTDRVQQLLRESTGLGWGNDGPQRGGSDLWNSNQFGPVNRSIPANPTYTVPDRRQ